jgi:hypothetical protein
MYPDFAGAGIVFTTIGVVTADPASVESVLGTASSPLGESYLAIPACVQFRSSGPRHSDHLLDACLIIPEVVDAGGATAPALSPNSARILSISDN